MIKTLEVENSAGQREAVKLQIWDTAGELTHISKYSNINWYKPFSVILTGQERFRSITQSYYRSAHALILVYDLSCQPTFDALNDWIREIQEYANPKVLKILVGNKTDRDDREIPVRVGEEFAKAHDMYFLETSSKQGENVEKLFYEIAAELIEQARQKGGLSRNHHNSSVTNLGMKNNISSFQSNCCSGGVGTNNNNSN